MAGDQFTGLTRRSPKAAAMAEYGGSYPGAYLLRRGLFLPLELAAFMDREMVREGLRRLRPLERLAASMTPGSRNAVGTCGSAGSHATTCATSSCAIPIGPGMAHSLEIRTPLVDFELLRQLAPVVPGLAPGAGKRALAAAPSKALDAAIVERAKTGFGVPTDHWLDHRSGEGGHLAEVEPGTVSDGSIPFAQLAAAA